MTEEERIIAYLVQKLGGSVKVPVDELVQTDLEVEIHYDIDYNCYQIRTRDIQEPLVGVVVYHPIHGIEERA